MTQQPRPVVVIVDSWTCSNFLLDALTALDVDAVQVKPDPDQAAFGPPMAYLDTVTGNDPAALAEQLAGYSPVAVLAAQEPDVPLADALSERLGLPSNGTALSSARRNKYDMAAALRKAGVRAAEQFKSARAADVVAWAEAAGRWPMVVKPLASAATDNVAICSDAGQVREAAETILRTEMLWGEPNSEVLLDSAGPQPISILEKTYGSSFKPVSGPGEIEQIMSNAGSGARGIVFGSRGANAGHVFNVVTQNGTVRFVDFQIGKGASFDGYQDFYLLRTNG
jgi:hypothetical protein